MVFLSSQVHEAVPAGQYDIGSVELPVRVIGPTRYFAGIQL